MLKQWLGVQKENKDMGNILIDSVSGMSIGLEFPMLMMDGSADSADLPIEDLLKRCLAENDADDWQEFYIKTHSLIAGCVIRIVCPAGKAQKELHEDLIQEVYQKLFDDKRRVLRDFDPKQGSVFGYLKAVTNNETIDHLRKRKRRPEDQFDEHAEPPALSQPEERMDVNAMIDAVKKQFSVPEFNVFSLYYRMGYTAKGISELPGIDYSEKQVEHILRKIKDFLKSKFGSSVR